MTSGLEALLGSALSALPALVFAALGGVLSERAGVVNVGLEGMMRAGAFAAAVAALVLPTPVAVLCGMGAGAAVAAVHGWLCLHWRAEQVVSGIALNLVMLAAGVFVLESQFSPAGTPSVTQLSAWHLPALGAVPVLRALSGHPAPVYLALVAPFVLHVLLTRTAWGLRLRAVGEQPLAVATLGVSVPALRWGAVLGGGLLAGLGGASLSVAVLDRFEPHMPSGLGFMALAAVVFGRWTPLGAFGAAAFFALGNAVRIGLAASFPGLTDVVPQGVLLALPYALTLLLLALQGGRTHAPAALGVPYAPEER